MRSRRRPGRGVRHSENPSTPRVLARPSWITGCSVESPNWSKGSAPWSLLRDAIPPTLAPKEQRDLQIQRPEHMWARGACEGCCWGEGGTGRQEGGQDHVSSLP